MAFCEARPYIKAIEEGNVVVVRHCPFVPPEESRIEKLSGTHYLVKSSGEVRRYRDRSEVKGDNLDSVRRSMNRLKAVINANCASNESVRFVTLTYAENMTDNGRIRNHMAVFFRRMREAYGRFEYVYVKERQGRGAWHMHCVLFFEGEAPYMANTDDDHPVRDAWGHGWVNVQGFSGDINNLGNYLAAYLTDDDEAGKKGARLANYESGVRLYNCSRGIRRPREVQITHEDYMEFASDEHTYLLSENEGGFTDGGGSRRKVVSQIFAVI